MDLRRANALNSTRTSHVTSTPAAESSPSVSSLPDKPLVVIGPSKSWQPVGLRELWQHRELLYFLAWRDLKVRYKQTLLGIIWVLLQPLLMTIIFTLILGRLAKVPSDNVPYPLFAYSGLMLWTFFSGAVSV